MRSEISEDEKFKKYLVKEVARMMMEKKTLNLLWPELQTKTGRDCMQVWTEMVDSATEKVMSLLPANDSLDNIPTANQLSSVDWLLFDLILVHEKMPVTNRDVLPQCIKDLYQLVQKHKVENLRGDELAESWIQLTLQYNNGGRQCSPMLLQLRWYQLKEMSRRQIFNQDSTDPDKIKLLHELAIKNQKVVTHSLPRWDRLIKMKRVILPEQFVSILNRNDKWTNGKADDGWYLQVNNNLLRSYNVIAKDHEIAFVAVNKPKTDRVVTVVSDNKRNNILCQKPKDITNLNTPKSHHEGDLIDNIFKDNSRVPVDVTESKNKAIRNYKNKTINFEINKVLQEEVKLIGELLEDSLDNDVDPKLLGKAIVYTKKLDSMKVFKYVEYDSVKDKKLIECATLESIPTLKRVTKTNQVRNNNFSAKTFSDQETTSNQTDTDAGQSTHEITCHTIKSTSWLLQKPKKRKYNSVQLCNNPDFNNKLKILTPAFLDCTSNRCFLSECKPVTIDLYKQFEKKLIDGKCKILEVTSTKSACDPNAVAPTETGQRTEINISTEVFEHNNDSILYNILSGSSSETRTISCQTPSERRKIINLPSIDQIREFNHSLLTAEVNPVHKLSKQPERTVPSAEPTVQSTERRVSLEVTIEKLEGAMMDMDTNIFQEDVV